MKLVYHDTSLGLRERVCAHGVHHPTVASAKQCAERDGVDLVFYMAHRCCGCCLRWRE